MAGVLGHSIVPMHEVMTNDEALIELEPLGLVKDGFVETSALPMIAIDDPALLGACVPRPPGVAASWPINSVVRITRRSVYAGITTFYRVVSAQPVYPTMRLSANSAYEIILEELDGTEEQTQTIEEEREESTVDELMSETKEFLEQEEDEQQ